MSRRQVVTALALLASLVTKAPAAEVISGVPLISDGDTLSIGTVEIRLEGIDAPEFYQICSIKTAPMGVRQGYA